MQSPTKHHHHHHQSKHQQQEEEAGPGEKDTTNMSAAATRPSIPLVAIVTIGSRGDLQPFLALAIALHQHHGGDGDGAVRTCLLFHEAYRSMVEPYPFIDFHHIGTGPEKALEGPAGQEMTRAGPFNKVAKARAFNDPLTREWFTRGYEYYIQAKPDLVVLTTAPCQLHANLLLDLGIPFVVLHLGPFYPTRHFAPPVGFGGGHSFLPFINTIKWSILERMSWALNGGVINECMVKAGRRPITAAEGASFRLGDKGVPVLMAYIQDLCPPPPDWPQTVKQMGPLIMPPPSTHGQQPPPHEAAAAFLDKHKAQPPIYIGFGSMLGAWRTNKDRVQLLQCCIQAARGAGVPVIIATKGCEGFPASDFGDAGDVLCIDNVPHTWLFPQLRAVVCHGGIGTVNAALFAGVPVIMAPADIPVTTDQPFWASRVPSAGLGGAVKCMGAILARGGDSLRSAIIGVALNAEVRGRAELLGRRLREEEEKGTAGVRAVAAVVMAEVGKTRK